MLKNNQKETIHAKGLEIGIYTNDFENEFISLTDIARYRNNDDPRYVIQNWMKNRHTIDFLQHGRLFIMIILNVCKCTRLEAR